MKKHMLTILFPLWAPICLAADFQEALSLTNQLKTAKQELTNVTELCEKISGKVENLEQNTKRKLNESLSLTNEAAKTKAYNKADARDKKNDTHDMRVALVKLEEELLEDYKKGDSKFLTFKGEKYIGEGHHLLFWIIKYKYTYNTGYLPSVLTCYSRDKVSKQTAVTRLETKLTTVMTTFTNDELAKFQDI